MLTDTSTQLAARTAHAASSDSISIRGASRPAPAGRIRRRDRVERPATVEAWRQLVNKRYDTNTRFLNLEVCLAARSSSSFAKCMTVNNWWRSREKAFSYSAWLWRRCSHWCCYFQARCWTQTRGWSWDIHSNLRRKLIIF